MQDRRRASACPPERSSGQTSALVRVVHQLTLENQQLRDMRSSTGGSVIPFPGREPVRPRD